MSLKTGSHNVHWWCRLCIDTAGDWHLSKKPQQPKAAMLQSLMTGEVSAGTGFATVRTYNFPPHGSIMIGQSLIFTEWAQFINLLVIRNFYFGELNVEIKLFIIQYLLSKTFAQINCQNVHTRFHMSATNNSFVIIAVKSCYVIFKDEPVHYFSILKCFVRKSLNGRLGSWDHCQGSITRWFRNFHFRQLIRKVILGRVQVS